MELPSLETYCLWLAERFPRNSSLTPSTKVAELVSDSLGVVIFLVESSEFFGGGTVPEQLEYGYMTVGDVYSYMVG